MKYTIFILVKKYQQLLLYGIIGGISAGLDFIIYTALCHLSIYFLIANIISIHCGIFCSFILNKQYNFKIKDKPIIRFFSFYVVGLSGLGISTLMLYCMIIMAEWNEIISKLSTIIFVALIQFTINKLITFKK
jgi:putative flippase GtrA